MLFRRLVERESFAPSWRELVRVLRLLELRGEVRGGRFVDGVWGEQFALPEAVAGLRQTRRKKKDGALVSISAADPLNLTGIITPGQAGIVTLQEQGALQGRVLAAVKEGGDVEALLSSTVRRNGI